MAEGVSAAGSMVCAMEGMLNMCWLLPCTSLVLFTSSTRKGAGTALIGLISLGAADQLNPGLQ